MMMILNDYEQDFCLPAMKSSQPAHPSGCLRPSPPPPQRLSADPAAKGFIFANPDRRFFPQKTSSSQQNRELSRLQVNIQCVTVCPGGQKQNFGFICRILEKSRIHTALLLFNIHSQRIDGLRNLFSLFRLNIHFDKQKSHRFSPQPYQ